MGILKATNKAKSQARREAYSQEHAGYEHHEAFDMETTSHVKYRGLKKNRKGKDCLWAAVHAPAQDWFGSLLRFSYTVSIGSNQDPWQQTHLERQAAKTVLHLRQTLPAENVQKLNLRVSVSLVSKPTKGFARFEATCAKKAHRATKLAEEALAAAKGNW